MPFRAPVAKVVADLVVYQKALTAARRVATLLAHDGMQRDRDLSTQINRASIRVVADIAEGFEQKTDRHFARYLYDARGGASEIRTHLAIARDRERISGTEYAEVCELYGEIGRMLSGLIRHLQQDDWKDRTKK